MPVFISYSHENATFAESLARQLVAMNVGVWIDRWELRVGDSLTNKIQDALTNSSALLVVLSKASVASEWCKREVTAGLMREMEERRVVVLPLLLEDCDVPLFLRDKMYADFRTSFDKGLQEVAKAISPVTTVWQNRIDKPDFHMDWGIDWFDREDLFGMRLVIVEHGEKIEYCVVSEFEIMCDEKTSRRINNLKGKEHARARRDLIAAVAMADQASGGLTFQLSDHMQQRRQALITITGYGEVLVRAYCRWIGNNHGNDVLYRMGNTLHMISHQMDELAYKKGDAPSKPKARPAVWIDM